MTDLPPSSPVPDEHDADLLASLYLDGEATAEEAAMVEGDARLMDRVAELRAVADGMARPIVPPVGLARRQIDAALEAFAPATTPDLGAATSPSHRAAVAPTSLDERRNRHSHRAVPSWLGAAAATVMVLGGLGFGLSQLGGSSDSDDSASVELRDGSDAFSQETGDTDAATSTTQAAEMEAASAADVGEEASEPAADDAAPAPENDDGATETNEAAADEGGSLDAATFYAENGPLQVESFEGITAIEIFETNNPLLLPIEKHPCIDREVFGDLGEPVGYAPLLLDSEPATLVVFEGEPEPGTTEPSVAAAVVLDDPSCEIILR